MEKYQWPYKDTHVRRLTFTEEEVVGGFRVRRMAGRGNSAQLVVLESGKLSLVSAGWVRPTSFLGTMVRREERRSLLEILVQCNGSEDGGDRESLCTRAQNQPVCTRSEETERDAEPKPRMSLRINGGIYLQLLPTQPAPFPPCNLNHNVFGGSCFNLLIESS